MAHIVQLNAAQQAQVKQLSAALSTAQASVRAAQKALNDYTATLVPAQGKKFTVKPRITVSDDSTALIVG